MNEENINGIAHTLEQILYAINCYATEQKESMASILNHMKYIGKEMESQTLALQRIEKSLTPSINSNSLPYPTSPGDLARRVARGEK